MVAPVLVRAAQHPAIDVDPGECGLVRNHTDDLVWLVAETKRRAYDVGIPTESAMPESLGQHDDVGGSALVLIIEHPPDHGGRAVAVGNAAFKTEWAIDVTPLRDKAERLAGEAKTPVLAAVDGALAGLIAIADPIKTTSVAAIRDLRALGLEVVMITGDNERTAHAVAA